MGEFFCRMMYIFLFAGHTKCTRHQPWKKGGKTMFGKNSKMSKNVQKSRTPRQKQASNVEAGSEMNTSNCHTSSSSNKTSNKTSNKMSGKSSTSAKNCK